MALINALATAVKGYVPTAPIDQYQNYIVLLGGAAALYVFSTAKKKPSNQKI